MKDLNDIANNCMRKLDALGIRYGTIVRLDVNRRAKKRWGQCRTEPGHAFSININQRLLQDDVPMKAIEETMLHELIHTCDGCMDHGAKWRAIVAKVNQAYGYNIKRANSSEDKMIDYAPEEPDTKYKIVCLGCGHVINRSRMSSFVKYYGNYRCSACHGKFKRVM